ncbi:polysaccharide deacetylase family protein [bacterium]|nr:polysaccharide deacetylase family protein [bacterium]
MKTFKIRLTSFIKWILFHLGIFSLIRILLPNDKVAILRYHSIQEPDKNFYASPSITISPEAFEKQVKYLSKRYNVISLDEVVDCIKTPRPFPKNSIVFTFDDGYADNYNAYKILKKYGATGTFYLTSACIDNESPLWLFEVHYLVNNTKENKLELSVNGEKVIFDLREQQHKPQIINEIITLVKSNNLQTREEIRSQLRIKLGVNGLKDASKKVMLTWEQVKEMAANGMTIGGHTLTHANLPNADFEDAMHEIKDCKTMLEKNLDIPIKHFSYPNGGNYEYFNDAIKKAVKETSFVSSTTSKNDFAGLDSDLYELSRIGVSKKFSELVYLLEGERIR